MSHTERTEKECQPLWQNCGGLRFKCSSWRVSVYQLESIGCLFLFEVYNSYVQWATIKVFQMYPTLYSCLLSSVFVAIAVKSFNKFNENYRYFNRCLPDMNYVRFVYYTSRSIAFSSYPISIILFENHIILLRADIVAIHKLYSILHACKRGWKGVFGLYVEWEHKKKTTPTARLVRKRDRVDYGQL